MLSIAARTVLVRSQGRVPARICSAMEGLNTAMT
jgi:hypothetical protein